MSELKTKYHDYIWNMNADVGDKARGLVSFLTELGLSSAGKMEWTDGEDNSVLTFGSSNLGIWISYGTSSSSSVYVSNAYKNSKDKWTTISSSKQLTGITTSTSHLGYRVGVRKLGGITLYSLIPIKSDSTNDTTVCYFCDLSMVDHYTSKSFKGACYNGGFYAYDNESKNTISLTQDVIGGTVYPNRNQMVAAPISFYNHSKFYGYAESPTTLYKIYAGSSQIGVGMDVQVKINGAAFQQLISGYFVRV